MNIQEAGQQIEQAIQAYLLRDDQGQLRTTVQQQRPPFLYGPPGIGKTEIVKQIATKMEIGFVDYSMTHHTRQSALGLPVIVDRNYGGVTRKVSDYTMSEILSSVYDQVEQGQTQGILFLDEVNCVSETLAPAMMKFLQYKIFGKDAVPEGWVVVTAGNPPEYNNSVKEYDAVTWDRLKRLDVEPNYDSWRDYSVQSGVHGAVLSYLDVNHVDFYKNVTAVDGRRFITARAWSDLSKIVQLYEELNYEVDVRLVAQYIQEKEVAQRFVRHYKSYQDLSVRVNTTSILEGNPSQDTLNFLSQSPKATLTAVCTFMADQLDKEAKEVAQNVHIQKELVHHYKALRALSKEAQYKYLNDFCIQEEHGTRGQAAHMISQAQLESYSESAQSLHRQLATTIKDSSNALNTQVDNVYSCVQTIETSIKGAELMWTQSLVGRSSLLSLLLHGKSKYTDIWGPQLRIQTAHKNLLADIEALDPQEV